MDHYRTLPVRTVIRAVRTRRSPHPGPRRGTGRVHRLSRQAGVSGQRVYQPRHCQVPGHQPEHSRLGLRSSTDRVTRHLILVDLEQLQFTGAPPRCKPWVSRLGALLCGFRSRAVRAASVHDREDGDG
jgi:hypothetical protein